MSLPPLNPKKTAAGIVIDPKTLERVVPSSRRSDGTQRKELKIRPGFTPQEDVGVFRSTRQQSNKPSTIPGSNNRPLPSTSTKPENPFAQPSAPKTKAQLKNEKRREKKRLEVSNKAWDESSDEDDEGDLKEAFERSDRDRATGTGITTDTSAGTAGQVSEESFPPLGKTARAPSVSIQPDSLSPRNEGPGITAVLDTIPAGGGSDAPDSASDMPGAPPPPANMVPSSHASVPVRNTVREEKPHPIQGGRKGPLGLAFPPPIEEPKPVVPSRADEASSWRTNKPKTQQKTEGKPAAGGAVGRGKPRGKGVPGQKQNTTPGTGQKSEPVEKVPTPEPRVRKEVKIRQGGANDIGSLASRVKNLVLDSQAPRQTRTKKEPVQGAEGVQPATKA